MPFKKGTSGNPIGRPKGSISTTSKLISDFDFSTINLSKLKNLLYQNVKVFNDDDHLMEYSNLEYQKDVKLISVSNFSIDFTETISYMIPVLKK